MANNIIKGIIAKLTAESLTDKESHVVKLTNTGAVTRVTAVTDIPFGVVENGAASGSYADINPVNPGEQMSVKVSADVAAGALLQIDASNPGQLKTQTATGKAVAMAEAAAAAGAFARVRFLCGSRLPTTVYALTSTNGTMAAAADDAAVKVEGEKIGDDVRAIHAALVTAGIIATS